MPRFRTLRVKALADLARQLRFESEEAAGRQVGRTEALLVELLEAKARGEALAAYPEDWVAYRVTGLRAEGGASKNAGKGRSTRKPDGQPASVAIEALVGDLVGLVEQLSSRAGMGMDELRGVSFAGAAAVSRRKSAGGMEAWLSIAEVAKRWGVARKTVERAGKAGLACRRIRVGPGQERAVYAAAMVEVYERAMRRLVRAGAGNTTGAGRRGSRVSAGRVEKAAVRGPRAGASRATEYRRELERRLSWLRRLDFKVTDAPLLERMDAAEVLLTPAAVRTELGRRGGTGAGVAALAEIHEAPNAERERALAAARLFLMARARGGIASLAKSRVMLAARVDRVETDLRWASRLKAALIGEQLPGALRGAAAGMGRSVTGTDGALIGVVIEALGEAVDRFDPFKGGRLAGTASLGVSRRVALWMREREAEAPALKVVDGGRERATARTRVGTAGAARAGDDWAMRVNAWQAELDVPTVIRDRAGELAERERRVLAARFGWEGSPPRTAAEIAKDLGTSATQVRAAERRALARLGVRAGAER